MAASKNLTISTTPTRTASSSSYSVPPASRSRQFGNGNKVQSSQFLQRGAAQEREALGEKSTTNWALSQKTSPGRSWLADASDEENPGSERMSDGSDSSDSDGGFESLYDPVTTKLRHPTFPVPGSKRCSCSSMTYGEATKLEADPGTRCSHIWGKSCFGDGPNSEKSALRSPSSAIQPPLSANFSVCSGACACQGCQGKLTGSGLTFFND